MDESKKNLYIAPDFKIRKMNEKYRRVDFASI
jgi:hypothetical protein